MKEEEEKELVRSKEVPECSNLSKQRVNGRADKRENTKEFHLSTLLTLLPLWSTGVLSTKFCYSPLLSTPLTWERGSFILSK